MRVHCVYCFRRVVFALGYNNAVDYIRRMYVYTHCSGFDFSVLALRNGGVVRTSSVRDPRERQRARMRSTAYRELRGIRTENSLRGTQINCGPRAPVRLGFPNAVNATRTSHGIRTSYAARRRRPTVSHACFLSRGPGRFTTRGASRATATRHLCRRPGKHTPRRVLVVATP